MKRVLTKGLMAAAALGLSGAAIAGSVAGNINLTNNYLFRGISQTDNHFAVQGGLDYAHESGLFAGVWASNVDFDEGGEDASTEVDLYGGYATTLENGIGLKFSGIRYVYPGVNDNLDYDYWEFGPSVSLPVMGATLTGTVLYSPEFFIDSGDATYAELGLAVPVSTVTLGGTFGHQDIQQNLKFGTPDYNNWSLYASMPLFGLTLKVAYQDTDLERSECFGGLDWCKPRGVVTVSKAL